MGAILTFLSAIRPAFLRRQVEYPSSLQDVCKDNLRNLDDSVVKHLKSLDAMQATADMLYRHLSINSADNGQGHLKATAARLLINIDKLVCDEREDFVSSLRTFLSFVMRNGGGPFQSDSIRLNELRLDAYEKDPNILQLTPDDYMKEIHTKNEELVQENEKLKIQIKKCKELNKKLEEESHSLRKKVDHVENEYTKFKEKMNNLQKRNKELVQSRDSEAEKVKKSEADMKDMEKKKAALHNELTKIQKQKDNHVKELKQEGQRDKALVQSLEEKLKLKEKEITDLRSMFESKLDENEKCIKQLRQKIEIANKTTESDSEIIKIKDQKIRELNTDVQRKEKILTELTERNKEALELARKEKNMYENNIKEKERKITELKRNEEQVIESSELDKIVMTEEKRKLSAQLEEVSKKLKLTTGKLSSAQEHIEVQKEEIESLKRELEEKKKNLTALREAMNQKGVEMQMLQEQYEKLNLDYNAVMTRCNELTAKLKEITSIKTLPVQLFCQQVTPWTTDLENRLVGMLNTEIKSVDKKIELNIFKTSRPSDVRPEVPLLLICITVSRIGTDAINATQGLSLTSNMALIVFHHKDEHALPSQASERVLTGEEMKKSGGIFDMAFKSDKGIYPCDMNTKTIGSLVTFLRRQIV